MFVLGRTRGLYDAMEEMSGWSVDCERDGGVPSGQATRPSNVVGAREAVQICEADGKRGIRRQCLVSEEEVGEVDQPGRYRHATRDEANNERR
jgi:hypothetical protein